MEKSMAEQEILAYRSESERCLQDLLSCRAGALIASFQTVEDGAELAWMYTQGDLRNICSSSRTADCKKRLVVYCGKLR